jgi:hypothetical protein
MHTDRHWLFRLRPLYAVSVLRGARTMSREAIEPGAFTLSRIRRLYEPYAIQHWQQCESEGLQCPQELDRPNACPLPK